MGSLPWWQSAAVLLVVGVMILILELFIPSAGMLFLLASLCIIAGIVSAFMQGTLFGVLFLVVVIALAIVLPGIVLSIWKRSPVGRRMFLESPFAPQGDGQDPAGIEEGGFDFRSLLNEEGRTLTALRPVGTCEIAGRRVDTVAEGVMIDRGERIRVVDVQGNRVVVRKITETAPEPWDRLPNRSVPPPVGPLFPKLEEGA